MSPSPAALALHHYSHTSGIPPHLHRDAANIELVDLQHRKSPVAASASPRGTTVPPHHSPPSPSTPSAKPTSDPVYLQPCTRQVPLRSPRPHPASTSMCTASAYSTKNEHAPATGGVWVGCDG
uniref:Uncharacterized protein n=1 Tax=Mycena chlorophos TaxID=658473 RepID=A0ABQ0M2W4_MYCCL|nr:predicted protein [Mycena chlorophos]